MRYGFINNMIYFHSAKVKLLSQTKNLFLLTQRLTVIKFSIFTIKKKYQKRINGISHFEIILNLYS